ncbi:MAG: SDR family oxidoreductase [Clostridia bacterium]|nr:SDR family oxidoreductase [Clostridia bacterium]
MQNTKSRVAFVTGGAGGIGSAVCRALRADGFAVAIGYHTGEKRARALADELCGAGGRAIAVPCDITSYASICDAKRSIEQVFGLVDTAVHCAGCEAYKLFCDESAESIAQTIAADLTGAVWFARAFAPDMVGERFGRIVLISSVWGVCGAAMETVYSAAKAGVIGFTKALAQELAPACVTVNAVSPGFIDTPMNARFSERERAAVCDEIPACRLGTPQDVAAAVRFLARDDAGYITGQNIGVTGGYKNV